MKYLIGKKLAQIRPMTKAEIDNQCWPEVYGSRPMALEFEDGTILFSASDEKLNGPGAFFGTTPDHKSFRICHLP